MRGLFGGCANDKQKFTWGLLTAARNGWLQAGSLLLAVTGEVMFYKLINMHMPAKQ